MARALGAKVYPNHTKEIGWQFLNLTEKGSSSSIRYLDPEYTSMFYWHGDTFDLLHGADLLASTN
jgi:GMP synthase (glutamine-hydrolysing)